MVSSSVFQSSFGPIRIECEDKFVTSIRLCSARDTEDFPSPLSELAAAQLQAYFCGSRRSFDLPLMPKGTEFQLAVWRALAEIPYGETRTYGQIAAAIGKPKAGRAVGMACNRNPLWIVVPCHRVVGRDDSLTGYAGGLNMKQALLELEKQFG